MPPINDLGTGFWRGYQGGLYPSGSNERPQAHNNAGILLASQIMPLDTNGNADPVNGKIVWVSVGMSNNTFETQAFLSLVDTFQNLNSKLVLVDGAQPGWDIDMLLDSNAIYWSRIENRLKRAGVHHNQVQVVWFKDADRGLTDTTFLTYINNFKGKLKAVLQLIKRKFNNQKLCYITSRIYAGYAPETNSNYEPFAYYTGWAVKWTIEDQINGDTSLTFTGNNPKSAWLSWGPYIWADGIVPRLDGLNWICPDDYEPDGIHPSIAGRMKVARKLFEFFSADETTIPWFLNNVTGINDEKIAKPAAFFLLQNYPNPFNPTTTIKFSVGSASGRTGEPARVTLKVYDLLGREVVTLVDERKQPGVYAVTWDAGKVPSGAYFYRLTAGGYTQTKAMVVMK